MAGWFPGSGFVSEDEVLIGNSPAGTPIPTTVGAIALQALLQERLSWALVVCARDYPNARRGIDVRELRECPHCGSPARGVVGHVVLDEAKVVGGAQAVVGECSSCGALN